MVRSRGYVDVRISSRLLVHPLGHQAYKVICPSYFRGRCNPAASARNPWLQVGTLWGLTLLFPQAPSQYTPQKPTGENSEMHYALLLDMQQHFLPIFVCIAARINCYETLESPTS
jgi:hypothetical protein